MFFGRLLVNSFSSAVQSRSTTFCKSFCDYQYMEMKNKVAVITGGTRGIGLAVAKQLLTDGVSRVIVTGRDYTVGAKTLKELKKVCDDYQNVTYVPMDVTSRDEVKDLFEYVAVEHGGLDILMNSAGVLNESESGWRNMINTNVKGVVDCTKYGMDLMARRNCPGVVVNLSSIFAIRPIPQLPIFIGTKAAVLGATLGFNKVECGDVRLVTACMGPTDTPMLVNLAETDVGEWAKEELLNLTDTFKIRLNVENAALYITILMQFASNGSTYILAKSTQRIKKNPQIAYTKKTIITF